MKTIGFLLLLNGIGYAIWHFSASAGSKWMLGACGLAVLAGLYLMGEGKSKELSLSGVGSIRETAEADAREIAQLKNRVEAQSATVDLVAKSAKEAQQLTGELKKKSDEFDEQLKKANEALEKANKDTTELKEVLAFTSVVVGAQSDSRIAFDQLAKWSADPNFRFRHEARQAWAIAGQPHAKSAMYMSSFEIPWAAGFDPKALTLDQIQNLYANRPVDWRPALLEFIWKRDDIPRRVRMAHMVEVQASDSSLAAVAYAGRFFIQGAEQLDPAVKFEPLNVEKIADWWRDNQEKFKD